MSTRLLAKSPTVGDLKLTPTAIYWLGRAHTELFEEEVYEEVQAQILKLAATEWVSEDVCEMILTNAANAVEQKQRMRAREESPTSATRPHLLSTPRCMSAIVSAAPMTVDELNARIAAANAARATK